MHEPEGHRIPLGEDKMMRVEVAGKRPIVTLSFYERKKRYGPARRVRFDFGLDFLPDVMEALRRMQDEHFRVWDDMGGELAVEPLGGFRQPAEVR